MDPIYVNQIWGLIDRLDFGLLFPRGLVFLFQTKCEITDSKIYELP